MILLRWRPWPDTVGLQDSVERLLTNKDESCGELEAIVVGAVGTGDSWFLTWWD